MLFVLPQVCVQGIPWKYTWKELKELLAECGEVERADVMTAPDGRSKVRSRCFLYENVVRRILEPQVKATAYLMCPKVLCSCQRVVQSRQQQQTGADCAYGTAAAAAALRDGYGQAEWARYGS
jgi:hypothetical protein